MSMAELVIKRESDNEFGEENKFDQVLNIVSGKDNKMEFYVQAWVDGCLLNNEN